MTDVITIDGPASSGKTSIGYQFAKKIGYQFIDSGSIYRAGTLYIMKNNLPYDNDDANAAVFRSMDLRYDSTGEEQKVYLNGEDITRELDALPVTKLVPTIAATKHVREAVREKQRSIAGLVDTVITGRDVGTVVFPDATLKLFITASPEVRAERRYKQLVEEGTEVTYQEILDDVKLRDEKDSAREESPFKVPEGAVVIDTTNINIPQTLEKLVEAYNMHEGQLAGSY